MHGLILVHLHSLVTSKHSILNQGIINHESKWEENSNNVTFSPILIHKYMCSSFLFLIINKGFENLP